MKGIILFILFCLPSAPSNTSSFKLQDLMCVYAWPRMMRISNIVSETQTIAKEGVSNASRMPGEVNPSAKTEFEQPFYSAIVNHLGGMMGRQEFVSQVNIVS